MKVTEAFTFAGNPKAICLEILAQNLPLKCVCSLQDMKLKIPEKIKKVRRASFKYYYYYACSKFLLQNGEFLCYKNTREKQIYINTQHGTPLKLMGAERLSENDNIASYKKNRRWSYLISPNRYTTEIFKRVCRFSGPVLEVGYPRNDIFYTHNNVSSILSLKKKMELPFDKKIILYAPTWRDRDGARVDKNFEIVLDLIKMEDKETVKFYTEYYNARFKT
ncbi:unnamed protein product [marine sediment metagenome]|uniref:Uncharacterized protein n=1 Tax=marine sediment metagenome TaxID=412755 RepID=X1GT87_9ZZZZ